MTTPTPGDLSARLQAFVDARARMRGLDTEIIVAANDVPLLMDDLKAAIAALSALPAGGGEDESLIDLILRLEQGAQDDYEEGIQSGNNEQSNDAAGRLAVINAIGKKVGCLVDTTPQPSAATPELLDIAQRARNLVMEICEDASFPIPQTFIDAADDAIAKAIPAVGAQGEGVIIGATRCYGEDNWFRELTVQGVTLLAPLDQQDKARHVLSAPAAGKGVDDAARVAEEMGAYCDGRYREDVDDVVRDWRDRLQDALTRQPVAGDGMVLSAQERKALEGLMQNAEHDAGDVDDIPPHAEHDEDAYWAHHAYHGLRKVLAPAATPTCAHEWVSGDNQYVSNTLICQRCYEIKPAATPTDDKETPDG